MTIVMNRRELVSGLAAGTVVAFAGGTSGCVENPALGRRQMLLVTDEQLAALSQSAWSQLRQQQPISRNSTYNRRLQTTGDRIVSASGLTGQNWEYTVFESDQINAFVMPGGKVGFTSGILHITDNHDQVATVMGHEVGHVAGRHAAERYSQAIAANAALTATNIALQSQDVRFSQEIAAILGAGVSFGILLPYSRKHEYEADRLGVQYMAQANYNPREALNFWQTMAGMNQGNKPLEFMSTHPSDTNRIREMDGVIRRLGYV
ncbi:MAG: M48 family metallopeptidase [Alphaproteobacteria bacterium]